MTIEIPTELLISPWFLVIGYFLISFLLVKPFKWFWAILGEDDKPLVGLCSFFWPLGILLSILIAAIFIMVIVYNYLIGD